MVVLVQVISHRFCLNELGGRGLVESESKLHEEERQHICIHVTSERQIDRSVLNLRIIFRNIKLQIVCGFPHLRYIISLKDPENSENSQYAGDKGENLLDTGWLGT